MSTKDLKSRARLSLLAGTCAIASGGCSEQLTDAARELSCQVALGTCKAEVGRWSDRNASCVDGRIVVNAEALTELSRACDDRYRQCSSAVGSTGSELTEVQTKKETK